MCLWNDDDDDDAGEREQEVVNLSGSIEFLAVCSKRRREQTFLSWFKQLIHVFSFSFFPPFWELAEKIDAVLVNSAGKPEAID